MYKGNDGELYGDIEETILACLLIEPKLVEKLRVNEEHFTKFEYVLTFFKRFYQKYHTLDITTMLSLLKGSNELRMMEIITYLVEVFALPTQFETYQDRLIERYGISKRDKWLSKKIYEKATDLYVGTISLDEFYKELKKITNYAKEREWK